MAKGLSRDDGHHLLFWLKGQADAQAEQLRKDGWVEDERGLWSRGEMRYLHLCDAVDVRRETGGGARGV